MVNSKDLEKALSSSGSSKNEEKDLGMSKEMEVGFHQGALNTLINERNELLKMAQITEQLMQAHMKRLDELGVKINFGNQGKK
jgi:hypothetical protein